MSVARILGQKGREVTTISQQATLTDVVTLLAAKGIGAVIVSDASHKVLGIVSERDVMRALAAHGAAVLDDAVANHMTTKVTLGHEGQSIKEIMEMMTAGRFRHLPVVANERLIGIVSIGDVVKWHTQDIEDEKRALQDYITTT